MELSLNDLRELMGMGGGTPASTFDNGMIGKYVIVRCRDAGVHAGVLDKHFGREAVLSQSRRLWYWKPKNGAAWLSGLATEGADEVSKIGRPVELLHLTETCEIILCSHEAEQSIRGAKSHNE